MTDEQGVDFGDVLPVEADFGDLPAGPAAGWNRTFATEDDLLDYCRAVMLCTTCERADHGDHEEPCPEQRFLSGCTAWKRRQ